MNIFLFYLLFDSFYRRIQFHTRNTDCAVAFDFIEVGGIEEGGMVL